MVTGPRALANLTSSSRQIASIQHFPCEAPVAGLLLRASGLQSAEKAQLPLEITPHGDRKREGNLARRLERKQSYPSAETPESDVGRRKRGLSRSCGSVLVP